MDTLLKSVYARAKKKGNAKNWISLDSIQCTGTNQLLLSSSKLSSVFKVSRVGSLLPSVDYIIADASQWKSYKGLKKKVLTKTLADGKIRIQRRHRLFNLFYRRPSLQSCSVPIMDKTVLYIRRDPERVFIGWNY